MGCPRASTDLQQHEPPRDIEAAVPDATVTNINGVCYAQTTAEVKVVEDSKEDAVEVLTSSDDAADVEVASVHSIGNQRNLLSKSRLITAFVALSVSLFVSFIDQTSVSTSIPAISSELQTGSATSWIGGSFLIASTAFQLINGRLSDIFGRKVCLLLCLGLLAGGDLLCGFAKTKVQLFVFRAIAGVGGGGVNSIVMIIVSDITTLENRGKFQGILGAIIALANGTGPFIGGVLVEKTTWRWTFWLVPMLAVPAGIVIFVFLPLKHDTGNYAEKIKKIDYGGIALNLAGVILVLIPLSGGGVTYAWNSALVIAMLTIGVLLSIAFVLYEWKVARVPIMPLRLFKGPHCGYLYAQNFFTGVSYFGNFFYLPIYFQSVLSYNALESGALILPLIIFTSIWSITAGQLMARFGRYFGPVFSGFTIWTVGTGLKCLFNEQTPLWKIIVVLLVEGWGIGLILQPTLVGLLANSRSEDRAVCTGLRNFIRTIGGAFGLIISGAILSNTLSSKLSKLPFMNDALISGLTSSTYSLKSLGLTPDEQRVVLSAYMSGLHYVFIFFTASCACNFLLAFGIGNTNLKKGKDSKPQVQPQEQQQQRQEQEEEQEQGGKRGQEDGRAESLGGREEKV